MSKPVILASASKSRAALLKAAGVPFEAVPAHTDEDAVKIALKAEGASAVQCAEVLAELKAVQVSQRFPDALVIGADQMLECEGIWFDKPTDLNAARAHLVALRGRAHHLPTSAAIALNGARIWHAASSPKLTMRPFSDAFIEHYLANVGTAALSSVGAYQLEGWGVQLFEHIDGDFFTILGLPLLQLLAFLREHEVMTR
jgi:septum formation protein